MNRFSQVLVAALVASSLPAVAAPVRNGGAVELVPHKATYSMRLGHVRSGGDVAGARGSMTMETAKSCAGWTLKHQFTLTLINNEGSRIETDSSFSSFESLDGLSYRFTSRTTRNGAVTEDIQGSAQLDSGGGAGTADFSRPKGTRFDLPKGTVFPTEHVKQLIASAQSGSFSLLRTVFDGQTKEGAMEVNAVVTRHRETPSKKQAKNKLSSGPSWHMRLAFFPLNSSSAEPQHEAGLRLFDNGVADDFEWDWGGFTVEGNLKSLEPLPNPTCP
ncbi:MAG: cell envelope integrity EipB family protein [Alphaproteobacteria bacterium]|nr:cell envelope integrity EipB family protein [Alphaproteobacteria bacterium]